MIPNWRQFSRWSLPSKVTYISFLLALAASFFAVFAYFSPFETKTSLISFVPEVPTEVKIGNCSSQSWFSNRATALRCWTPAHSGVGWDPCFELAVGRSPTGMFGKSTVVCNATPWDSTKSFVLDEDRPRELSSEGDSFHGSFAETGIWAVTLRGLWGDWNCRFISGATGVIFGKRANFFCNAEESFFLIGYPRPGDIWTIRGVTFNEDGIIESDKYYEIKTAYN